MLETNYLEAFITVFTHLLLLSIKRGGRASPSMHLVESGGNTLDRLPGCPAHIHTCGEFSLESGVLLTYIFVPIKEPRAHTKKTRRKCKQHKKPVIILVWINSGNITRNQIISCKSISLCATHISDLRKYGLLGIVTVTDVYFIRFANKLFEFIQPLKWFKL